MFNLGGIYDYLYQAKSEGFEELRRFFSFRSVKYYFLAFGLANLLAWLEVYYMNRQVIQDYIVLHYNVDLGVSLLGGAKQLYVIPFLGLIFFLANALISLRFTRQDNFYFLSNLLLGSALLAQFFLLCGIAALYLVNFQ